MSLRVGTDIVETDRFATVLARRPALRNKIFSSEELEYCDSRAQPSQHLAARFCAKEAFAKALGTGVRSFSMVDVEVVRSPLGNPGIQLSGRALEISKSLRIMSLDLSLSHSSLFALAVVVLEIHGTEVV